MRALRIGAAALAVFAAGCGAAQDNAVAPGNDVAGNGSTPSDGIIYPGAEEAEPDERRGNRARRDRGAREGAEEGAPGELAELPETPEGLDEGERTALAEARAIAEEIAAGDGIEQIEARGGAAWLRGGEVVRIAQTHGGRVFYFRSGEDAPFLVQRGATTFFVADGAPTRAISARGQVAELSGERLARSQKLVRRASEARAAAQ